MTAIKNIDYQNPFPLVKGMEIPGLRRRRKVWAFLPSDYANHPDKRYPVIYFQDAQNIFEGWNAAFGVSWEVHNTMKQLAHEGLKQCILIGIEHGKKRRFREYRPFTRKGNPAREGNTYADFVVNKLKPYVDKKLRTIPWREQTAIIGSSMGGLISLYTGLKHQNIFGYIGGFSPSLWASPALFDLVKKTGRQYPTKIYLTIGQEEGYYAIKNTEDMFQTLTYAGFPQRELYLGIRPHGRHDEYFWRQEFEVCYRWFFG